MEQWPVVLNVQLVSLVSFPSGLQVHSQYLKVVNSLQDGSGKAGP